MLYFSLDFNTERHKTFRTKILDVQLVTKSFVFNTNSHGKGIALAPAKKNEICAANARRCLLD